MTRKPINWERADEVPPVPRHAPIRGPRFWWDMLKPFKDEPPLPTDPADRMAALLNGMEDE